TLVLAASTFVLWSGKTFGQNVVLGVLEDQPGYYAGDSYFRAVRVVFHKNGPDWWAFRGDCRDQDCLKKIPAEYPQEEAWTIAFDGKSLGSITSRAPTEYKWYASVGQEQIVSTGVVPTVGERSTEFAGQLGGPVYRPLVANSHPYIKDPDLWKPFTPSQDRVTALRQQFRKQFPKLCRHGGADSSEMKPLPYRDADVKLVKAYGSRTGWIVARLHLQAVDCEDAEAGFDIDDPWFVVDPAGTVKYLDSGMWLVDAGDYDNDGKSELVFSIDRDNRGGYLLFYDDFKKHVAFEYTFH
ncbi:MAG TPA: hypothetical protein VKT29_05990, partial [Terriglobales bacterium]|nr:hypothetical protein [Terriglobales bacterium]